MILLTVFQGMRGSAFRLNGFIAAYIVLKPSSRGSVTGKAASQKDVPSFLKRMKQGKGLIRII